MSKIFGIGLPKSGTSSLHLALQKLGYRSLHFAEDSQTVKELRNGNYRLTVVEKYDALMDMPFPAIFAQLDDAWPNSRFILTVRPVDAWIRSSRDAGFNQDYAIPKPGSTVEFFRAQQFGVNRFHEQRYRWIYETHHDQVRRYFSGERADRFLEMDFSKPPSWTALCSFLGCEIPDQDFPHANPKSARKDLSPIQRHVVGALVSLGIDYRTLRRIGNRTLRRWGM